MYSDKVTSQKISESWMDNRGSKSITGLFTPNSLNVVIVKEQRVDGSWQVGSASCLRCTLAGFERNYQFRIPSNQINKYTKRYYSSNSLNIRRNPNSRINPIFINGLVDALGIFECSLSGNDTNWRVKFNFVISLDKEKENVDFLNLIKKFFGVGYVRICGSQARFIVDDNVGLREIIKHFEKYHLFSKKLLDFNIFKYAFRMKNKGKADFAKLKEIEKVLPTNPYRNLSKFDKVDGLCPHWIAGFVTGIGRFDTKSFKSTRTSGEELDFSLSFVILMDDADFDLIDGIAKVLKCRFSYSSLCGLHLYKFTDFPDIIDKIVPFFNKYPLSGSKRHEFVLFQECCTK